MEVSGKGGCKHSVADSAGEEEFCVRMDHGSGSDNGAPDANALVQKPLEERRGKVKRKRKENNRFLAVRGMECRETRSRAKDKERKRVMEMEEEKKKNLSVENVKDVIRERQNVNKNENEDVKDEGTCSESGKGAGDVKSVANLAGEENLALIPVNVEVFPKKSDEIPVNIEVFPKANDEELRQKLSSSPVATLSGNEEVGMVDRCLRERKARRGNCPSESLTKKQTGKSLTTKKRNVTSNGNALEKGGGYYPKGDRKRQKTEILRKEKAKQKSDGLKLESNDVVDETHRRRFKAPVSPIAKISKEGITLIGSLNSENLLPIKTHSNLDYLNGEMCRKSKFSSSAASSPPDQSLACGEVGSSSKISSNGNNRKVSEKTVTMAKGKCNSNGMHGESQKDALQVSSNKIQPSRKTPLTELRRRAKEHLLAAGWTIDLRPRNGRDYLDSVYISPKGSSFWSLPKAWGVLKQNLRDKFAREEGNSELLQQNRLSGNDCGSESDKENPTKPVEAKSHGDGNEGGQVSELSSLIKMVHEEDISLLERKRKDRVGKKRKTKIKTTKEKKDPSKGGRNERLIHYLESWRLLKGKSKKQNCGLLNAMVPGMESCWVKGKNGKPKNIGNIDRDSLKRMIMNGRGRNGDWSKMLSANAKVFSVSKAKKRKHCRQNKMNSTDSSTFVAKGNSKKGKKRKKRRGGCGLLVRSSVNGGEHDSHLSTKKRSVLSWLIDVGVVSENEMVQYINKNNQTILMEGRVTRDGILCKCCNRMFPLLDFEAHAGSKLRQPSANLFLASAKSLMQCQMEAWAEQRKTMKVGMCVIKLDESDQNDDTCGLCGDGGDLLCCDKCPSTFHQDCLMLKDLPDGNWYCPNCVCAICATIGHQSQEETTDATTVLLCEQCERKYHRECLHERGALEEGPREKNIWFCGKDCAKVFSSLNELLAVSNPLEEGFSWTLLRRIEEDEETCSSQREELMAECNARLAVALAVMEECFIPMVDPRTDLDMIPQVVFNCGSNFSRLNYPGFYTIVLDKGDEVISVASIRIHGTHLAEMPFVGTRHQYRRQGMCRRLITAIEKMLLSLEVEKLILPAIPDLLETWTKAFYFQPLESSHKEELRRINMMVFPGTTLLQKSIFKSVAAKDADIAEKYTDMHTGFNDVDSETLTQISGSELKLHEKSDRPGSDLKSDLDISHCVKEIGASMLLPEEGVSKAFAGTRNDNDLGMKEEENYIQSVSCPSNVGCPAFVKLEESMETISSSSEGFKPELLDTSVDNLYPSQQFIHHTVAIVNQTGL